MTSFEKYLEDYEKNLDDEEAAHFAAFEQIYRLAAELFEYRSSAGLTQRELSSSSGVPQSEISRIECGDANPTVKTLTQLGNALGIELTWATA